MPASPAWSNTSTVKDMPASVKFGPVSALRAVRWTQDVSYLAVSVVEGQPQLAVVAAIEVTLSCW